MSREKHTPEELQRRREEREKSKEERIAKDAESARAFPGAMMANRHSSSNITTISLEEGRKNCIHISMMVNNVQQEHWIFLDDDVYALSDFIKSLILRYNAIVSEMNANTDTAMIQAIPFAVDLSATKNKVGSDS